MNDLNKKYDFIKERATSNQAGATSLFNKFRGKKYRDKSKITGLIEYYWLIKREITFFSNLPSSNTFVC
jgi:hypothetical protein